MSSSSVQQTVFFYQRLVLMPTCACSLLSNRPGMNNSVWEWYTAEKKCTKLWEGKVECESAPAPALLLFSGFSFFFVGPFILYMAGALPVHRCAEQSHQLLQRRQDAQELQAYPNLDNRCFRCAYDGPKLANPSQHNYKRRPG